MTTATETAVAVTPQTPAKPRVFSGIQPSGTLHIGNYLGAIKNWVADQERYDNIFCIVDLHAITVPQDAQALHAKTRELAMILFAAGISPERSALFVQSHITAHAELTWILNCVTPLGWLYRMTQFKDKSGKQESVGTGLLDYPVLMTADILLYQTDYVPVGDDQRQHVELARDIARRFNNLYGETFVEPEAIIPKVGARIMGLDDPTAKMSKSIDKPGHAIPLLASPDEITRAIKRAVTDSQREIVFDEARPGLFNLLTIYQLASGLTEQEIEARYEGKGYGDFKSDLAELVIEFLRPLQERYQELASDPAEVERMLARGADQIRPRAEATLQLAKDRVGLG